MGTWMLLLSILWTFFFPSECGRCPERGVDFYGADMPNGRHENLKSWQACGELCHQTEHCDAWAWGTETSPYQNTCWLKLPGFQPMDNPGRISGFKNCYQTSGCTKDYEDTYICAGNNLARFGGSSVDACTSACCSDDQCKGWTFRNGWCWLKSDSECTGTASGWTTGKKEKCKCGLASRKQKIFGGQETEVNEYPWMVDVRVSSHIGHWCGGSLISDLWVLTAAHCLGSRSANQVQVILGDHDTSTSGEAVSVLVNIQQIIIHPNYNSQTEDYDAALLKMTSAIDFNIYLHIRPICLPEDPNEDYKDFVATTTGWGALNTNPAASKTLQEIDVDVLTNAECRSNYWSTLPLSKLCTTVTGGGKNVCGGDSGGPLVTSGNGDGVTPGQNYELIGITSQTTNCEQGGIHVAYFTQVKSLVDWISGQTDGTWITCPRTDYFIET